VVFVDTAGLREAGDEIEVEGIRRSRESLARAEFILHVLDGSEGLTPSDEKHFAEFAGKKRILVRNKTDLPSKLELPAGLLVLSLRVEFQIDSPAQLWTKLEEALHRGDARKV